MADSGLMGEVLSSLQTELLATLKGVEARSVKAHLQEAGQCQMMQPGQGVFVCVFICIFQNGRGSGVEYMSVISARAGTVGQCATMHSIMQKP